MNGSSICGSWLVPLHPRSFSPSGQLQGDNSGLTKTCVCLPSKAKNGLYFFIQINKSPQLCIHTHCTSWLAVLLFIPRHWEVSAAQVLTLDMLSNIASRCAWSSTKPLALFCSSFLHGTQETSSVQTLIPICIESVTRSSNSPHLFPHLAPGQHLSNSR